MQDLEARLMYIYCIAPENEVKSMSELPMRGIDGERCELLMYRGLAVVLCRLNSADYNEQALETKVADTRWVANNATNHHEVIASIHAQCPVVPLPFCTLFSTAQKLHESIDERYEELSSTLRYLADKESWSIKIYCNEAILREKVKSNELDSENMEGLSPGKQYIMLKRINQIINDKVEQEQEKFTASLHEKIKEVSASVCIQKSWNEPGKGEETMTFNCTYLVPSAKMDVFADHITAFQEWHNEDEEWRVVVSGPWPPYHFVKKNAGRANL